MKELKLGSGFNGILGLTRTAEGFQAAVNKKQATDVRLRLYDTDKTTLLEEIVYPRESFIGEVASLQLLGIRKFPWYYTFVLDGQATPDPYATVVCGREAFGTEELEGCLCGYLPPTGAREERAFLPERETLLYKLHVRGFTMDKTSGVRRKGTFTGVKEKLPYLKSLGINALLLMPCYDFLEQKPGRIPTKYEDAVKNGARVNYWGYTGGFYFVPKASYCATKQPHKEFAELVEACHKADMDLYMEFYFGKEAGPELISRVLYFWKQQYGVDGFSVTGEGLSPETLAKNPVFAGTRLIFPYANGGMQGEKPQTPCHIGVADSDFQSVSLSFLKSDENQLHGFMEANRRNPQGFSQVNYVANHNGFTLTDAVSYDFRHNEENGEGNRDGSWQNFSWNCGEEGPSKKKRINTLRYNQKRNAILMLYLAQGIPLLYAGDEQGNSQQGNNNAWCQDNEIGWVQYSQRKADKEFLQFVKEVIAFRKAHPVFAMEKQPRNTDYKAKGLPDLSYHGKHAWMINTEPASRGVGMLYNGAYEKQEPEELLYVVYNMYWQEEEYALPTLPRGKDWCLMADTSQSRTFIPEGEEIPLKEQKRAVVPGRCIQIFCARKVEENERKETTEQTK